MSALSSVQTARGTGEVEASDLEWADIIPGRAVRQLRTQSSDARLESGRDRSAAHPHQCRGRPRGREGRAGVGDSRLLVAGISLTETLTFLVVAPEEFG